MRVLVTGGAGFIGSNFVRNWGLNKYPELDSITVLDKLTYAGKKENIEHLGSEPNFNFIEGDICDVSLINQLIKKVDCIINFAAESHVDRSITNPNVFVKTNIEGVQVLLDAVTKNSNKRFLQVSTDEVYGSIEHGTWDESEPLRPNSPYSATKAAAELLVNAYSKTYGIDTVITRSSNNYGPYQYPEKIIPLFITNLMQGRTIPIYGEGSNIRDWLHVTDHCKGIYLALTKGTSGSVYNIGGGHELSNMNLAKIILSKFGSSTETIEFVEDRKGHDFRYAISSEKAAKELGYESTVDFNSGLEETIRWYEENTAWWINLIKK